MSDQATVTAPAPAAVDPAPAPAPVAPTTAPEAPPAVPETPPPSPAASAEGANLTPAADGPTNAREAVQRMRDRVKGKTKKTTAPAEVAEVQPADPSQVAGDAGAMATEASEKAAPVVDAQGKLHDPKTGQFVAKGEATESPVAADVPEATAEVPSDHVTVGLPEGHPLRDRGIDAVPFPVPKEHEETMRALVNGAARASQLQETLVENQKLRARERELELRLKWRQDNPVQLSEKDEYLLQAVASDEDYGPEYAQRLRDKLVAEASTGEDEAVQAEMAQHTESEVQQQANQFRTAVLLNATARYPGWRQEAAQLMMGRGWDGPSQPGTLRAALDVLGAQAHLNSLRDPNYFPTKQDWFAIADAAYAATPSGQAEAAARAKARANAEAKATQEANEAGQAAAAKAAASAAANPLGNIPRVQTTTVTPSGAADRPTNARDALKRIKDRARGRVKRQ